MTRRARRDAEAKGRMAEFLALWMMRLKGYRLLAKRHRTPLGEIDLVMCRGSVIAFVEVKARSDLDTAQHAITPQQRGRIVSAANHFVGTRSEASGKNVRFDVIAVAPGKWPRHIVDAWRP